MHYELITIIPGTRTETEVPTIKDQLRAILTEEKAAIVHEEDLGKQKLAYPIKREQYGTYFLFTFDLEPKSLARLHDRLRLSEHLLRHSIVKKEKKTPEQLEKEIRLRARIHQVRREGEQRAALAPGGDQSRHAHAAVEEKTKEAVPINLEELDKKLDEILDAPIEKI